jgi:GT2 family glycosyltransferase
MLNLLLLSGHQDILDKFFESIMPTIKGRDVKIYVISEGLEFPESDQVIRVDRTEFHPNKYFNFVCSRIPEEERQYVGIINDDIWFFPGWLDDVLGLLEYHSCVSPGFLESKNVEQIEKWKKEATDRKHTMCLRGFFCSFYVFNWDVFTNIGVFDEDFVDYYDLDWYARLLKAKLWPVFSNKVSVLHMSSASKRREIAHFRRTAKEYKGVFLKKHGPEGYKAIKNGFKELERHKEFLFL